MLGFVIRRLTQAVPVLLLTSTAVFLLLRLIPGDPVADLAGENASPERVEEIRRQLGMDGSIFAQYGRWLSDVLHGDLGRSVQNGVSVGRLLRLAGPPTVELALVAYPLALLLGIPLGVLAGARPRSRWDWALSGYTAFAVALPSFVLGVALLWLFSVRLGWLPASGHVSLFDDPGEGLRRIILPALSVALVMASALARYTRTALAEVMRQDYVRTAWAKGAGDRRVVLRHALPNALVPVITIAALQFGHLLTGAVVAERIFTRPGLGDLVVRSIQTRDYPVVQGALLMLVAVFVAVNLLADLAYGIADPRIRRS